jgi:hypothetical protein
MGEAMKKTVLACIAASILLAGIGGCYYIPTGYNGTARASIGAKDVPVYMTSVALVVTGPGMMPIKLAFPPAAPPLNLDVPAGPARTFTLFLTTPSATLSAEETVDLAAGEEREILFTPKLGGTEILIPDAQNSRIVQISTMTGAGWIEKGSTGPTDFGGGSFMPYDVDFDDQGRIYIANAASESSVGDVVRIDDINHVSPATCVKVESSLGTGVEALAVDRVNGYIYYTKGYSTLYRKNINSPNIEIDTPESFDLNATFPNFGTTGIAVDEQGYVYLTNNQTSSVVKYDPDPLLPPASRLIKSASVETPWDVMVTGGKVLVTDPYGINGIAVFDTDLNPLGNYSGPALDPFVGPRRFLGALGMPGIYITDENNSTKERVIFMQDISGAGWVPYGSHGSGPGQFEFFTVS